jgi:hypothetical protein
MADAIVQTAIVPLAAHNGPPTVFHRKAGLIRVRQQLMPVAQHTLGVGMTHI